MPEQKIADRRSSPESLAQCISISTMTEEVLQCYKPQIDTRNILVDTDLTTLSARVYPHFIHSAVCQLIENAIDAMPSGGELNVTLVDGEACWELEVSDSRTPRTPRGLRASGTVAIQGQNQQPDQANHPKLEMARCAALLHGGKMQTWNCPLGGTANVLVIPRRQETGKAA